MPLSLRTTLCETRDALHLLQRSVRARGHIDAMYEIDCLVGLAHEMAVKAVSAMKFAAESNEPRLIPQLMGIAQRASCRNLTARFAIMPR